MSFNTRRPPGHRHWQLTWFATVGGAAEAHEKGALFRWQCRGCRHWSDFDFADYLCCEGPTFPMWNLLSVCDCGAPRTLHATTGPGTPMGPLKDDFLWVIPEIGWGHDPDAWFEIDFME